MMQLVADYGDAASETFSTSNFVPKSMACMAACRDIGTDRVPLAVQSVTSLSSMLLTSMDDSPL